MWVNIEILSIKVIYHKKDKDPEWFLYWSEKWYHDQKI